MIFPRTTRDGDSPIPRFQPDAFHINLEQAERLEEIVKGKKGVTTTLPQTAIGVPLTIPMGIGMGEFMRGL